MKWHTKEFGCIIEHTHPHFETLTKIIKRYYVISQFDYQDNLEWPLESPTHPVIYRSQPICYFGEVLYGISDLDGRLIVLKMAFDTD